MRCFTGAQERFIVAPVKADIAPEAFTGAQEEASGPPVKSNAAR